MSVTVLKPGLLSTMQDTGRHGFAQLGVGPAGSMDGVALRLANALVGNDARAAALEMTLIGPRLRFDCDALIALTGAAFEASLDNRPLPTWRPVRIAAGSVLDVGQARRGMRACLGLAGGFSVAAVLGSAATDVNARLGPYGGRPLRAGDVLHAGAAARPDTWAARTARVNPALCEAGQVSAVLPPGRRTPAWSLDPRPWFDPDPARPFDLIRGAHFDALDANSRSALFTRTFHIGAQSDRVGFRLEGPRLALAAPLELVSEAVAAGTLQLPAGGQPIALMAEHPTTGGYPRIGQIAAVDLPRLAQQRPRDPVRFREVGLDHAQTRYLARERELADLIEAITVRLAE